MMHRITALALVGLLGVAPATPAPSVPPTPAVTQTPPPVIYHTITRPMCSELHEHLLPVSAMMLQDDRLVAKSKPLLADYLVTGYKVDPGVGDTTDYESPSRTLALGRMGALSPPLAQNVLAIQKMLENTSLAKPTGNADDDKELEAARQAMHQVLVSQRDELNLINGFVQTEQLGDIQHGGDMAAIAAIARTDLSPQVVSQMSTPSPNPFQSRDTIGVSYPDPHNFDTDNLPPTKTGDNGVKGVVSTLGAVQDEAAKREQAVASSLLHIASLCGVTLPPPSPSPGH